jgi:hypothetical protein
MGEHYLSKLAKKKSQEKLLLEVGTNVNNIAEERIKIGKSIQNMIEKGFPKKTVLESIRSETFLSIPAISSMIDEFTFNNDFDLDFILTSNEIKIIKKIFKDNKFSYVEQKKFLNQSDLKEIIALEHKTIISERKEKYIHTVSFDEEGEILFQSLKEILQTKLKKKINNSELMYYAMIELYNSNPTETDDTIDKELKI